MSKKRLPPDNPYLPEDIQIQNLNLACEVKAAGAMSKKRLPPDNPYLTEDIQIQILSRSLVKSLMRFRCVSKRWCSIISDSQEFVQLHLAQSDVLFNRENILNVPYDMDEPEYGPTTDDDPYSGTSLRYVGTCNGLVCLSMNNQELIVFNPSIGRYRELPLPQQIDEDDVAYCGFGYDSAGGDYKIFSVCLPNRYMVFSFKDNFWSSPELCPNDLIHMDDGAVFVNGSLYWKCFSRTCSTTVFISFDLSTKKFKEFPEPDNCLPACKYSQRCNSIGAIGKCLWASRNDWNGFGYDHHVWVLKENNINASWVKLLTLPIGNPPTRVQFPEFFLRNGEILVAFGCHGNCCFLACYLLEDRQEKIGGLPEVKMIRFTESLVSPNCGKEWKGNPLFMNFLAENVTYFSGESLSFPSKTRHLSPW